MKVRATRHSAAEGFDGYTEGRVYNVTDGCVIDDNGKIREHLFIDNETPWFEVVDEEDEVPKPGAIRFVDKMPATKPEFVDAVDFINKAAEYVGGARTTTHGDIVAGWRATAVLHEGLDQAEDIAQKVLDPALRATLQMILLKISRIVSGAYNPDDFVDIAGYAGCAGEIAAQLDADE